MRLQGVKLVIVLPAAFAARTKLASDCVYVGQWYIWPTNAEEGKEETLLLVGDDAVRTGWQSYKANLWTWEQGPWAPKSKRVATSESRLRDLDDEVVAGGKG
ncbi:hypothetical protein BBK36DRAFT_1140993 [Trichoderma citrinoviride]|uniref:Uncharacterized protein n=1 Tax=Trichoderma citrinoviride TaxID=58853 RepID=A0A2T4B9W5_9HYPO|nr:hypothetical protein BBK36DRAFT_1140993 [Trichoderma citrinoviride]PTB66122.1 hypothetical protein BBK36DRAFT_1140993 [Trichoderma citrinoviride]